MKSPHHICRCVFSIHLDFLKAIRGTSDRLPKPPHLARLAKALFRLQDTYNLTSDTVARGELLPVQRPRTTNDTTSGDRVGNDANYVQLAVTTAMTGIIIDISYLFLLGTKRKLHSFVASWQPNTCYTWGMAVTKTPKFHHITPILRSRSPLAQAIVREFKCWNWSSFLSPLSSFIPFASLHLVFFSFHI